MIVIDVGCAEHHGHDSISRMINRFRPGLLLGFDPWPGMRDWFGTIGKTKVVRRRIAAWTRDGHVGYVQDGWGSYTTDESITGAVVPCFDLNTLVTLLPRPVILKLNAEGAELALLNRLADAGLDRRLDRCIVQWHAPERIALACPIEDYP